MLLRLIIENILSFKDRTEFNTFPGGIKSKNHHKVEVGYYEWLKLSAIYGANGAGKSNLIEVVGFLRETVRKGRFITVMSSFKLDESYLKDKPSKIGIEFSAKGTIYYYEIEFRRHVVIKELLLKNSDQKIHDRIFERFIDPLDGKTILEFEDKYLADEKDQLRIDIIRDDVLKEHHLVLSIPLIHKIVPEICDAYTWISDQIIIITPHSHIRKLTKRMIRDAVFFGFLSSTICALDTGLSSIVIRDFRLEDFFGEEDKFRVAEIKDRLETLPEFSFRSELGEAIATKTKNEYIIRILELIHKSSIENDDEEYHFHINEESEGTQRLFDLIPMAYDLITSDKTFFVDEIERSIHPVLIRELLGKIFEYDIKGQLIFTTHESELLDFDLLRQDEFWLLEKNDQGVTGISQLSNHKPRFDLDIRRAYLNGKFNAVPILSDLKQLKWNFPQIERQKPPESLF